MRILEKKPTRIFILLLFTCFSLSFTFLSRVNGQENQIFKKGKLTRKQFKEDFQQLLNELERHPQRYSFVSEKQWQTFVEQQKRRIENCNSIDQFYRVCLPLVAKIGCGHTNLYNLQYNSLTKKSLIYLPYKLEIRGGQLFVAGNLSSNKKIPLGSEITEINGEPVKGIVKFIMLCVPSDGNIQSYKRRMASKGFTYYYHALYGLKNKNTIKYKFEDIVHEMEFQFDRLVSEKLERKQERKKLDFVVKEKRKIGLMKIRTFSFYNRKEEFQAFVRKSIQMFLDKNLEHLIIDLRGNQGGDPYCSDFLLRAIADKPIQYYKDDKNYPELTVPNPPLGNIFKFKPIVLIDGLGFSSTGHFAALVQEHGLGVFVGEELGSTFRCNGGQRNTVLKHTKLFLQVGQKVVDVKVSPSNFSTSKGILPDFPVSPTIQEVTQQDDVVLKKAMELIQKRK